MVSLLLVNRSLAAVLRAVFVRLCDDVEILGGFIHLFNIEDAGIAEPMASQ